MHTQGTAVICSVSTSKISDSKDDDGLCSLIMNSNVGCYTPTHLYLVMYLPVPVSVSMTLLEKFTHRQRHETKKFLRGLSILLARGEQPTNLLSAAP